MPTTPQDGYAEGSQEEEASESPAVEATEDGGGSVDITEQFQKEVAGIIGQATKVELDYLRSKIMDREKSLMKAESKSEKSQTFDVEGMPE